MGAYSFLDVQANIVGPGGAFAMGSGAGVADEGITTAMAGDKNTMVTGADGTPMHSLHADKSGTVTVRLLKTSPTNAKLNSMYNLQTTSAAAHGINTIVITNPVNGDTITCAMCAFKKHPDQVQAKDANVNEWVFDAGYIDTSLGGSLLAAAFAAASNLT